MSLLESDIVEKRSSRKQPKHLLTHLETKSQQNSKSLKDKRFCFRPLGDEVMGLVHSSIVTCRCSNSVSKHFIQWYKTNTRSAINLLFEAGFVESKRRVSADNNGKLGQNDYITWFAFKQAIIITNVQLSSIVLCLTNSFIFFNYV